jgi:hypothetical protein
MTKKKAGAKKGDNTRRRVIKHSGTARSAGKTRRGQSRARKHSGFGHIWEQFSIAVGVLVREGPLEDRINTLAISLNPITSYEGLPQNLRDRIGVLQKTIDHSEPGTILSEAQRQEAADEIFSVFCDVARMHAKWEARHRG